MERLTATSSLSRYWYLSRKRRRYLISHTRPRSCAACCRVFLHARNWDRVSGTLFTWTRVIRRENFLIDLKFLRLRSKWVSVKYEKIKTRRESDPYISEKSDAPKTRGRNDDTSMGKKKKKNVTSAPQDLYKAYTSSDTIRQDHHGLSGRRLSPEVKQKSH